MSKINNNWINLDFSDGNALTTDELYYDTGVTTTQELDAKVDLQSYKNFFVQPGAMKSRVTNGAEGNIGNQPTTRESTTNNVMTQYYAFDTTTEEGVQYQFSMPDDYDGGTIKIKPYWDADATASGTAVWGFKGQAYGNDNPIDAAWGSEVTSTDTLLTVGDMHIGPATAALTIANTPALGDMIVIEIVCKTASTIAVDTFLMGIGIQYRSLSTATVIW